MLNLSPSLIPSSIRSYMYYSIASVCVMFLLFPSPLPTSLPLFIWAAIMAFCCSAMFYILPNWTFLLITLTCIFAIHVTRRYTMYMKQPVGIYDLSQFTSTDGSGVLPATRTQSVFSPAPALTREGRRDYLENLKHAPRHLGGNNFDEKTLEEQVVNELTPLGKSFILPVGSVQGVPGLYLGNDAFGRTVK